jgi:hypothetical protein
MSTLPKTQYDPILTSLLSCWRCGRTANNIPTLKQHLQEEWNMEKERERKRARAKGEKRKREEVVTETMEIEPTSKRLQIGRPLDKSQEVMEIED